jgi:hypothetical protein
MSKMEKTERTQNMHLWEVNRSDTQVVYSTMDALVALKQHGMP